ncbi:lysylphosphatidylglycerol synthase transmembrane domain-containing protein [Marinobacter similis]|uniref:lysylphosphatidylglycerol synthase transmembrane domain-containing protein n=1 Tax=Marinobacter similis TaxID=1420916 RepID=UPI000AB69E8A|nr:lysylphosphatidylglycerol synthase transmembrane domain-containing protein [Marinobacter similis]
MAFLLLAGLALFLDLDRLWLELQRLPASLLLPAFALAAFQVGLSAWRWRYTAKRLGLQMSYSRAFREYYLASFLNQVLPGGVMGDVGRAWRHSRETDKKLGAVHAVIIERLSGQFALFFVVVWAVVWLSESGRFSPNVSVGWLLPVLAIGSLAIGLWMMRSKNRAGHYIRHLWKDLSHTLFGWPALPIQLGTSLLVLGSYLAVFFLLAQQAGI